MLALLLKHFVHYVNVYKRIRKGVKPSETCFTLGHRQVASHQQV